MKNKIHYLINQVTTLTIFIFSALLADDRYKMPPKALADLVDAPVTPSVSISPNKKQI